MNEVYVSVTTNLVLSEHSGGVGRKTYQVFWGWVDRSNFHKFLEGDYPVLTVKDKDEKGNFYHFSRENILVVEEIRDKESLEKANNKVVPFIAT